MTTSESCKEVAQLVAMIFDGLAKEATAFRQLRDLMLTDRLLCLPQLHPDMVHDPQSTYPFAMAERLMIISGTSLDMEMINAHG